MIIPDQKQMYKISLPPLIYSVSLQIHNHDFFYRPIFSWGSKDYINIPQQIRFPSNLAVITSLLIMH